MALTNRFGWVDAELEPKQSGRSSDTAYRVLDALLPDHRFNISEYFGLEGERNMYVILVFPQVMTQEVAHPSALPHGWRLDQRSKHGAGQRDPAAPSRPAMAPFTGAAVPKTVSSPEAAVFTAEDSCSTVVPSLMPTSHSGPNPRHGVLGTRPTTRPALVASPPRTPPSAPTRWPWA